MALELRKAQRSKAYLKLGLSAPSGGGKTLGSLLIAYGLMKKKYPKETDAFRWSKIAVIDTENGSGSLYANMDVPKTNVKVGEYNTIALHPPFEAMEYTNAIQLCEDNEIEVCIIDSSTHLWSGEGGLLEQQNSAAKRSGNSYTAWRDITPMHNRFVEKMLQCNMHVIATMRAKQEYVQEKNSEGKTTVRKLGLEPEQRKGMEYEFTAFYEINNEHEAFGAKDRTSIFDQRTFTITPEIGETLMTWLEGGTDEKQGAVVAKFEKVDPNAARKLVVDDIIEMATKLGGSKDETLMAVVKQYAPSGNPNTITDVEKLEELKVALSDMLAQREQAEVNVQTN